MLDQLHYTSFHFSQNHTLILYGHVPCQNPSSTTPNFAFFSINASTHCVRMANATLIFAPLCFHPFRAVPRFFASPLDLCLCLCSFAISPLCSVARGIHSHKPTCFKTSAIVAETKQTFLCTKSRFQTAENPTKEERASTTLSSQCYHPSPTQK